MTMQPRSVMVRILTSNKEDVVGMGFLVDRDKVVTCAHVIEKVLGIRPNSRSLPQEDIHLDFGCLTPGVATAHLIYVNNDKDIAGLKLETLPVDDPRPCSIKLSSAKIHHLKGHSVSIVGFPGGYEQGVAFTGKVIEILSENRVQIEGERTTGLPVEGGFSGAPVWDDELQNVIGMVYSAEKQPEAKVAFMIPMQAIINDWGILEQVAKKNYVKVPILVVAMNKSEAKELFENGNAGGKFQEFKKYFTEEEIDEWIPHYEEERESWHPYSGKNGETIYNIIWRVIAEFNGRREDEKKYQFVYPEFVSNDFFDDEENQDKFGDMFEKTGALVIVDAISMFHPKIQKAFSRSEISSYSKVHVFGVAPVNTNFINANDTIEKKISESMWKTHRRFCKKINEPCEFGISNLHIIKKRLYNSLPIIEAELCELNKNMKLERVREQVKESPGYFNWIIGGGIKE